MDTLLANCPCPLVQRLHWGVYNHWDSPVVAVGAGAVVGTAGLVSVLAGSVVLVAVDELVPDGVVVAALVLSLAFLKMDLSLSIAAIKLDWWLWD